MLEAVHRDLAKYRRDRVLDPPGQQVEPAARVLALSASSRLNVSASPKTEAVSAVVSGVEELKSPSGSAR